MERRLFERRAVTLKAELRGADDLSVPCMIRDYCAGGFLVSVAGAPEQLAQYLSRLTQGMGLTVLVPTQKEEFELQATVRRVADEQLGLQLQRSNPRLLKILRKLHDVQRTQGHAMAPDGLAPALVSVRQAPPEERDRALVSLQTYTHQFLNERLTAFFNGLKDSRYDTSIWGGGFGGNSATDIVDNVLRNRQNITDKFLEQALPFFTVEGLRAALARVEEDEDEEVNLISTKMSLVDEDEFEEWLHVKVIARRLEDQSEESLSELSVRMRYLIGAEVTPANNGLTPESWVGYLREALRQIDIDFNTLKIILDCYQQHFLDFLKVYYGSLNKHLGDNGILPGDALQDYINENARNEMLQRQAQALEEEDASPEVSAVDQALLDVALMQAPEALEVDDALEQSAECSQADLLAGLSIAQRFAMRAVGAAQRFMQSNAALTGAAGMQGLPDNALGQPGGLSLVDAVLNTNAGAMVNEANAFEFGDVLDRLNLYQREVSKQSMYVDAFDEMLLDRMRTELGEEKHWSAQQANALALTKRLFMLLERNKQISDNARERLASLMVITFKALLLDPDALVVEDNPIRCLLNLLAKTGLKGAVMSRAQDAQVQSGIDEIIESLDRDFTVLDPLLKQLDHVHDEQAQFFERNIERLRETCEGQYRIAVNRDKVESAINKRLSGRSVPYVIRDLVDCGWRDLMYFSLMKEGEQSKGWNITQVLLEDLIRLLSSNNIRMDALRMPPDKMMTLIERGLRKVATPQNAGKQKTIIPQLQLLLTRKARLTSDDFEPWQGTTVRPQVPVNEPEALRINISAITDSNDGVKPHLEKWYGRAKALALGSWLDFQLESGDRMAGRLLWRAEDDSRLVFVNRQGMKLSDISIQALAEGLHRGDFLILATAEEPAIESGLDSLVQEVYSELANEVARDEVTNLLARREIERLLERYLEGVHGGKPEFFVIYIRVDQLSTINASCGYEAGDAVLKQLADRLFDTRAADCSVGRSSGTDFVMTLLNASAKAVLQEADRLLASIMSYRLEWEGMQFNVGASIGVVEVDEQYQSVDSILMDAQSACLTATEAGGNRIQVYSEQEQSIMRQQNRIVWASKVDEVLESKSLRLKLQKIAPTKAAQAVTDELLMPHYEVLIGSLGKNEGSVFDFICAAERYKRMSQVDRWIVNYVCQWMVENRQQLERISGLSINLSGNSLNDGDFIDHLFEVFTETQVPCDKLCFEITETVALSNLNDTVDFMKEMKNLGCRFAMDDFGTGMSSFAYLKHLPVDYLKIDGAFVKDMQSSRHDMAMVKSITDMGHLLGKKVVAEFVADAKTLADLETIGVDYCQGFFIEEPLWLDSWQDGSRRVSAKGRTG